MKRKITLTEGLDLYRVVFADGGEEYAEGSSALDAAKKASRRYTRKRGRRVRVLKACKHT